MGDMGLFFSISHPNSEGFLEIRKSSVIWSLPGSTSRAGDGSIQEQRPRESQGGVAHWGFSWCEYGPKTPIFGDKKSESTKINPY